MKSTLDLAIANFLVKNELKEEDIRVTTLNDKKAIIRIPGGNMKMMREAAETVYFGELHPDGKYDIFTFQCITRTSGILEYNELFSKSINKNEE